MCHDGRGLTRGNECVMMVEGVQRGNECVMMVEGCSEGMSMT